MNSDTKKMALLGLALAGVSLAVYMFVFADTAKKKDKKGAAKAVSNTSSASSSAAAPSSTVSQKTAPDNEVAKAAQEAIARRMQQAGASNANANANAALVYKMMQDPKFKLEPKKPTAIEQHIKGIIKKGFWDTLRADLKEGKFERVVLLVGELRDRLMSLVPSRADVRGEIVSKLDTALLQQMLQHGAFDEDSLCNVIDYILSKISQLESPVRDAETTAWKEAHMPGLRGRGSGSGADMNSFVEKMPGVFEFLFDKMEQIELDIANYQLQQLRPFIVKEGFLYQRKKFQQRLDTGQVSLACTIDSVKAAVTRIAAVNANAKAVMHIDVGDLSQAKKSAVHMLLASMIVHLTMQEQEAKQEEKEDGNGNGNGKEESEEFTHRREHHHSHSLFLSSIPATMELEHEAMTDIRDDLLCIVRVGLQTVRVKQLFPGEGIQLTPKQEYQLHSDLMKAFLAPVEEKAEDLEGSNGKCVMCNV
jgi:hypothetical protein